MKYRNGRSALTSRGGGPASIDAEASTMITAVAAPASVPFSATVMKAWWMTSAILRGSLAAYP